MSSKDVKNTIFDEKKFLFLKEKMKDDWMKDLLTQEKIDKDLKAFFENMFEEFSQNSLLIGLLQFQCQHEQINSSFITPYFFNRSYSCIRDLVEQFYNSNSVEKIVNFLKKKENEILSCYFWTITFPNIFGSFFTYENCKEAFNFLTHLENDANIFSKGVISLISHNYLFQKTFLNAFYTLINKSFTDKQDEKVKIYNWCKYDLDRVEDIIQTSLFEALHQLNSHQIQLLNKLLDKYPQEAKQLIFTDIILFNFKFVWPYSSFFFPNEMLTEIKTNYIDNRESFKDPNSFLEKLKEKAKNLISKNEIILTEIATAQEDYIVTQFDLILIQTILENTNPFDYPQIKEYSQKLKQTNSKDHIKFIYQYAFKYHKFSTYKNIKIQPDEKETIDSPFLQSEWKKHEDECKMRNENPFSDIYNGKPINKEVAYYGLFNAYNQNKVIKDYKAKVTSKMGILIPLQKSLEFQNFLIDSSSLMLSQFMNIGPFPESLISLYVNHIKNLLFTFSKDTLIKYKELGPLFDSIFEDTFSNEFKGVILTHIRDFTFNKKSPSILYTYFNDVYHTLKEKVSNSIPDDTVLNGKDKKKLAKECQGRQVKSLDRKSFHYSFFYLRKIEYSFTVGSFLNTPQKIEYTSNDSFYLKDVGFDHLSKCFDELDNFGTFCYIESVIYRLYKLFKSSGDRNEVVLGPVFVAVPLIEKMVNQFFYKMDGDVVIHPVFHSYLRQIPENEAMVKYIFKYSALNKKMAVYADLINDNLNEKTNVLHFFKSVVDKVCTLASNEEYKNLFVSFRRFTEEIEMLRNALIE